MAERRRLAATLGAGGVPGRQPLGAGITTDLSALHPDPVPARAGELLDRLAVTLLGGGIELVPHPFTDVADRAWYADGVCWVAAEGIATGFRDGTYRPQRSINRAEMVVMLWRAAGSPEGAAHHAFADVPDGAWYRAALDWAVAAGIVTGFPDGTYRPKAPVNRGQAAMMLFRTHGDLDAPLSPTERAALVDHLGGESTPVDADFLATRVPDLVGLLLALPRFQHR